MLKLSIPNREKLRDAGIMLWHGIVPCAIAAWFIAAMTSDLISKRTSQEDLFAAAFGFGEFALINELFKLRKQGDLGKLPRRTLITSGVLFVLFALCYIPEINRPHEYINWPEAFSFIVGLSLAFGSWISLGSLFLNIGISKRSFFR